MADRKAIVYQSLIVAAGLILWLVAAIFVFSHHRAPEQLTVLLFVPVVVLIGLFPNTFTLKREKITFTLSDSFIFLIACWYGTLPAVFVAGVEAFISSRRSVRRVSSNLFSAGMLSLAAAAAGVTLNAILHYGFHEAGIGKYHSFLAVTVALLPATAAHVLVNVGLLSFLFALRSNTNFFEVFRGYLSWAAPIALPTSAVASLAYLALQYNWLIMILIGAPILIAISFGHRQYRNNMHQRIELLEKAHRETIEALAVAINAKDEVTHEHVLRVQIYASGVARLLGCTDTEIEALKAGALLHDIGKIAVPDYILNKPGKLTAAEFEQMKMHTIVGAQILGRVDFPYPVVPIVRHHHERWDGHGYPDGLKAEEIPLTARILTVVDCFDALREDRQYRRGLTREEALDFLLQNSGSQYDPQVVGKFITHLPEFEAQVAAHKDQPLPTFGIEAAEELSEAARQVPPSAGLAAGEQAGEEGVNFSRKELAAVYELVQALNGAGAGDELVNTFMEKLGAIVPYTTCALTLASESGDMVSEYARGLHSETVRGRRIEPGQGITGWVLTNQKPFFNTDPRLDFPVEMGDAFKDYRTIAALPIVKEKQLYGALTLYSSALAEYDQNQQKLLREMTAVFADALVGPTDTAQAPTENAEEASVQTAIEGASVLQSELTH
jgi:putative nucleotidyltransferase with HDIG domain